jgi:hypothetical protein
MPGETSSATETFSVEEAEFLWCLCYGVLQGEIKAHPEYALIARALEPRLYAAVKRMVPGWESPLKQQLN